MDNQTLISGKASSAGTDNPFAGQGIFMDEKMQSPMATGHDMGQANTDVNPDGGWDALMPGQVTANTELGEVGLPRPEMMGFGGVDSPVDGMPMPILGNINSNDLKTKTAVEADEAIQAVNGLPPGVSARETTKAAVNWAVRTAEGLAGRYQGNPGGLLERYNEERRKYQTGAGAVGDSEVTR